jgi:uncharacterized membrane protein (Fun14 family)
MNSIVESLGPTAATMGGGFFVGVLIGYALKKVIKIAAVIVGLFLAGLAYLQYHQIATIDWYKVEQASAGIVNTIINTTKMVDGGNQPALAELDITNLGIPLTSSISVGFTIGFMKG